MATTYTLPNPVYTAGNTITASQENANLAYITSVLNGGAEGLNGFDGANIASDGGTIPLAAIPQLTAAQLAANSVDNSEIATDAVREAEIQDLAVTTAKLALDVLDASKFGLGGVRMEIGTYSGNASATQAVVLTDAFEPDAIIIIPHLEGSGVVIKTSAMETDAMRIPNGAYNNTYVSSFDSSGFTLADGELNTNGQVYSYIAFKVNPANS